MLQQILSIRRNSPFKSLVKQMPLVKSLYFKGEHDASCWSSCNGHLPSADLTLPPPPIAPELLDVVYTSNGVNIAWTSIASRDDVIYALRVSGTPTGEVENQVDDFRLDIIQNGAQN